jgi:kinesin family member 1
MSVLDERMRPLMFDTGIASAMTVSSAPQVGIRVIDYADMCSYVWDITKFQQQLQKMQSLRAIQHRPSFVKHFAVDPVFLDLPAPSYTFLGSVLIPLSTLLVRQSACYTLTIFCRDTGEACGTCRTSFEVSSFEPAQSGASARKPYSRQGIEKLDFTFCVDMVKAFSSEDVSLLHMQIKLSSLVGEVAADDTFASNIVDLDETSAVHLKLRRNINIDTTNKTTDHFKDQYAVLEFFGRAKETYLRRLEGWDERREARVGASHYSPSISPAMESISEPRHTVVSHVRILELDQNGIWTPVEVRTSVTEPSVFQLHQGLQRRLSIRLSHDSARSLDWTSVGCVDLSNVRLVSCKRHSTSHDHQKIVEANHIGNSKVMYTTDGQGILSGIFSWDTSSHASPYLDGQTAVDHHVLLRLTFQVTLAATDDPALFSQDIAVAVLPRDARSSSKLLGYLSGTKIAAQSSSIFSLKLSRPMARNSDALWQLDTGGQHVEGQELLGKWRPRTPRLVEDFLSLREIERKQADVQVTKGILRRLEAGIDIAVEDKEALLRRCVDFWSKTVGETTKVSSPRCC